MCYEQADYNAEMEAMAAAEAAANAAEEYQKYLDSLVELKQYRLFAIEVAIDILHSSKSSGLTPMQFFLKERDKLIGTPIVNPLRKPF